jgi:hypothetical protein
MNKSVALGLEIGVPILAIGGYLTYRYFQNKQYQSVRDSAVGVTDRANEFRPPQSVYNDNDYSNSDLISGGRKKSKRRKHRKNTSKKRR